MTKQRALVDDLRALCNSFSGNYNIRLLAGEAADEIERLQRYVEALESVADSHGLQVAQAKLRATDEPNKAVQAGAEDSQVGSPRPLDEPT